MLRLHDTATGTLSPVTCTHRGELRTYTIGPAEGSRASLGDLRSLLLADIIRRIAQRHRLLVIAWRSAAGGRGTDEHPMTADPGDGPALRADCDALNIYPAEFPGTEPGLFDIGIASPDGTAATSGRPARWVRTAPVVADGHLAGQMAGDRPLTSAVGDLGLDPLALRLALLQRHYRQAVTLGPEALSDADQDLRRWRERVADWATTPSKPMCAQYTAEISGAFDDDLDLPGALSTMRALMADGEITPGSKFESFAHLDQVLGLDLAREVGQ